ncbi:MAG: redox-sensing transcriptional repressor Rex [Deltaproteobacteria bacterium]|nr:redox-sensing transcriptional repressor Rex [Candidatus Zymogenaceae bacterium]
MERTVERLILFKRYLKEVSRRRVEKIRSHELAEIAGVSAAQVRQDIMNIGYSGNQQGYAVKPLTESIEHFLATYEVQNVAIIGIGNLGRAIIGYFSGYRSMFRIIAGFDSNQNRTGRVIHGCKCYLVEDFGRVVGEEEISIAIIAVPASSAQSVADLCIQSGIKGIVNFTPTRLHVPKHIYVSDMDIAVSLEKVAFFVKNTGNEATYGSDK